MQNISRKMDEVAVRPIDLQFFAEEDTTPNLEDTAEFAADAREYAAMNDKLDKYVESRTGKEMKEETKVETEPAQAEEIEKPEVVDPEKPKQDSETNKAFQEMRKAREEAERIAKESEERARRADKLIADQYGHLGITTVEQYEQRLAEEREAENNQRYQEAGLTPEEIQKLKDYDRIQQERSTESLTNYQQTVKNQWQEVFAAFPDLDKREIVFDGNQVILAGEGTPEWFTPEMIDRLSKGYSPLDAYKAAHFDKILQGKLSNVKEEAKQEALDKLNSKDHLAPNATTGGEVDHVEIDPEQMAMYRKLTGKSDAEIRKFHKKQLAGG